MVDKNASLLFQLRQHEFFSDVSDDALNDLLRLSQSKLFKARQTVFRQGDEGDSLYMVMSGRIKVATTSAAGKETVLCFLGPGEMLGEIAVLDGDTRTATVSVIEESQMLVVNQRAFFEFLELHPKVALRIIRVLCGRLRKTNTFVEEMTTLQAGPRLARALLRLAEQYGRPQPSGAILVDIKLSQANLGAHAGLMRENVNRQLKLWEDEGLLEGKGGVITLHNPEALELVADNVQ